MSAILKDEEFVAVEAAVKAGTAPKHVVDAFNELSTLRGELKKLGVKCARGTTLLLGAGVPLLQRRPTAVVCR